PAYRADLLALLKARTAGRYRVDHRHDQGGLGEIFLAYDRELKRPVALKKIKDALAQDPAKCARFVREAEITGGLEHPGIVPVYSLGTDDDGRPYYVMRFIEGPSLQQAIEQFHAPRGTGSDPARRAQEFQELLRRFIVVCNTIAYAHSRGVLHRDIKPDNI